MHVPEMEFEEETRGSGGDFVGSGGLGRPGRAGGRDDGREGGEGGGLEVGEQPSGVSSAPVRALE